MRAISGGAVVSPRTVRIVASVVSPYSPAKWSAVRWNPSPARVSRQVSKWHWSESIRVPSRSQRTARTLGHCLSNELAPVELVVRAAASEQLVVGAALDDLAV